MGSFRSEPQLTKETYAMSSRDHCYAVSHMCGWRKFMEDAILYVSPFTYKNYSLFGVFDGHGGPQVALFTKKYFSIELQKNEDFKKGNFQEGLRKTFLKIDILLESKEGKKQLQQIREEQMKKSNSSQNSPITRIGCTSLVILVTKTDLYIANAGDCRAMSCSFDGKILHETKDHKPSDPSQQARILKAGGYINHGRVNGCLNLTRAIGDLQFKQNKQLSAEEQAITSNPDVTKISRDEMYFTIIGCDGVWECKQSKEMADWMKKRLDKRKDLGKTLEVLLDEGVAKDVKADKGTDNMSAVLIKYDKK